MQTPDITLQDVFAAHRRIRPIARRTPLIPSPALSADSGVEVQMKLDFLQDSGAFKLRGAANRILKLNEEKRARGVVTFSTGNHGLAVALVANRLAIPATVCVSERVARVSPGRIERLRALGARVDVGGDSQDAAGERAMALVRDDGLTLVPPFDHPDIIAGQGTLALELMEDWPELDTVLVQVSGGGLAAGVGLTLKHINPGIRIIGLSSADAPVMRESVRAGRPVELPERDSIAESLLGGIGTDNRYTLPLVSRHIDDILLLDDAEIERAMAFVMRNHRLGVEGAAAIGVAALLEHRVASLGKRVAVILSGANVELSQVMTAVQRYPNN